jgi:hypothetical protein
MIQLAKVVFSQMLVFLATADHMVRCLWSRSAYSNHGSALPSSRILAAML